MKKAISLLLLAAMFAACKKTSLQPAQDTSTTTSSTKLKSQSARDGVNDVLGYGYDVNGVYGNSSAATFAVIDVAQLKADHPDRFETDLSKTQSVVTSSGMDAYTYLKTVTGNVTAGLNFALFKATITATYNSSDAMSSQYLYGMYNLNIQQKRLKLNASTTMLQSYLNPTFVSDVQNESPAYIVSHYGTHVLTDIVLGANLSIIYQGKSTSTDRTSAASYGLSGGITTVFTFNSGLSTNTTATAKNFDQTLHYVTHGGDPSKGLLNSITFGGSAPTPTPVDISTWQSSSTEANAEMIDIGSGGLLQISELVADPTKKAALETYISQYLSGNQVQLLPSPFYEYYQQQPGRHAYNLNPHMNIPYPSFAPNGQPFKVYTTSYNGNVPIYQFTNPASNDHVMTTNANPGWGGYNNDGILGYAYNYQAPGTVPLYEFYNGGGGGDHYYSTNRYAVNGGGWVYNGQPFYVYPN